PMTLKQILGWRQQIILQAALNFKPHILLVDKVAAGVHGELLPTLRHLKTWEPNTQIVLGMRDIEDNAETTRREWTANHTANLLNEVYDRILLYGERQVFDPVLSYGMSVASAVKLVECGYLRRDTITRDVQMVRRELGVAERPLVVVTVGGGGDGYDIIKTYLDMLIAQPNGAPYHSLITTGPLMPIRKREALERQATHCDATLLSFTPDLTSYINAADLVVSMAGYNTVCEILSLNKRAILIPRMRVRTEQLIRAEGLARRGIARCIRPDKLTPQKLANEINAALAAPMPDHALSLNGLVQVSATINQLLADVAAQEGRPFTRPNFAYTLTTAIQ
ncbi:MAG: glycosyltransferase family protein, partial [Anaerolineae bacterium]